MKTFVKIPSEVLKDLMDIHGLNVAPRVYVDKNALIRHVFWKRLEVLIGMSRTPTKEKVLDFGGGNGILSPTLSRIYKKVICVDLKTEMGRDLCEREGIKNVLFLEGNLFSHNLLPNSFDTIIAADVLEHIKNPKDILENLYQILKPGGELLVSSPTEILIYKFGRFIFGYLKPIDHFHSSKNIDKKLSAKVRLTHRRYFPFYLSFLSAFSLVRFEKECH